MAGVPVTLIMPKRAGLGHCSVPATYIDHSIGSDAEEGGSLVDCFDLLPPLHGHFQPLEFTERALQGRPVLGDQVITRAEVIELADQDLQGALELAAVRLGCGLLVPRVIWRGEVRGHIYTVLNKRGLLGLVSTPIVNKEVDKDYVKKGLP